MKKLFLIVCCFVGGSTHSAHAMQAIFTLQAAVPAILCGAVTGGILPIGAGLAYIAANKKADTPFIKTSSYYGLRGALLGGSSGIVAHVIAKCMFQDPSTFALVLATFLGTSAGWCGIWDLYVRKVRVREKSA